MFLSYLQEKQKKLFLEFAYCLAKSDGSYGSEEKEIMNAYSKEMGMEADISIIEEKNYKDLIDEIDLITNEEEKKIFIFEALGIVLIDKNYADSEKKMIETAVSVFKLDYDYIRECKEAIEEYLLLQKKIENLILLEK